MVLLVTAICMPFLSFSHKAESLLVISVIFTNSKTVTLQAFPNAKINQLRVLIRKIVPLTQTVRVRYLFLFRSAYFLIDIFSNDINVNLIIALAMKLPPFMITTSQRYFDLNYIDWLPN